MNVTGLVVYSPLDHVLKRGGQRGGVLHTFHGAAGRCDCTQGLTPRNRH